MLIGGFQKLTLVDYPGKVASVLFTVGCNLRCQFCYNPEFVLPEKIKNTAKDLIDQEAILQFLRTQKNMLDGLVICG
ncbi:MAG: 4Fe-4S cluster-binding domain-containing protein [bacterium]